MTTMLAYHGQQSIKDEYLGRVTAHREADQLLQKYGYWHDGKGCAVGCTIHGQNHKAYETELGIPEHIAHLEDVIFEGLPSGLANIWPERFLGVIKPGADLSLVWNRFAVWLLTDSNLLVITDQNKQTIAQVVALHQRVINGNTPTKQEWLDAAAAAARAARAAWAAEAAAEAAAARAARAAWAASRAAEAAAEAAASRAAAWAAERAAWETMAAKLLVLLETAPIQ